MAISYHSCAAHKQPLSAKLPSQLLYLGLEFMPGHVCVRCELLVWIFHDSASLMSLFSGFLCVTAVVTGYSLETSLSLQVPWMQRHTERYTLQLWN